MKEYVCTECNEKCTITSVGGSFPKQRCVMPADWTNACFVPLKQAGVAQLDGSAPCKGEYAGSNPATGSSFVDEYTTTPEPSGLSEKRVPVGEPDIRKPDFSKYTISCDKAKRCKICGEPLDGFGICKNGGQLDHHPMYMTGGLKIRDGYDPDNNHDYLRGFRDGVLETCK